MDAAIHAADRGLFGSIIKRFEASYRHPVFNLCGICKREVILEKSRQRFSSGGRYYTMPAGILWERRCLQQRHPILIQVLIDVCLGTDDFAAILLIPTTDKTVNQRQSHPRVSLAHLRSLQSRLAAGKPRDVHPMASW